MPHISVQAAAKQLIEFIGSQPGLADELSEGKMMGVTVCRQTGFNCTDITPGKLSALHNGANSHHNRVCFIAAFSGNVGGKSHIEGFVPPIFDLLDPNGYFKTQEAEITKLNRRIKELSTSAALNILRNNLEESKVKRDRTLDAFRERMAVSKAERTRLRSTELSAEDEQRLIRESQFEKAEFKRLKTALQTEVDAAQEKLDKLLSEIASLKKTRAEMSDSLQDWIFRQYIVHNGNGGQKSIADIFAAEGLVPPGGTGECAAPKLLEYAYRNGLEPLAMGEFWYGKASDTAVRTHGHFYPSCTSKCGPLLDYMLEGLNGQLPTSVRFPLPEPTAKSIEPIIIYEDDHIIVAEKPSGMPSVPGLDGRLSLEQWLNERTTLSTQQENVLDSHTTTTPHQTTTPPHHTTTPEGRPKITAVHRLDMDTSGVLIFAKTPEAESNLKRQFEEHTVRKTYMARLCAKDCNTSHASAAMNSTSANSIMRKGTIELPLSPDYDERPRQKVDFKQGKAAKTEYELVSENPDGTIDIIFRPVTGRTHQLRVHSAHHLGLGRPIVGDLLYGGWSVDTSIGHGVPQAITPHTKTNITNEGSLDTSDVGLTSNKVCKTEAQASRLHLHAHSITFKHPSTGEEMTFSSRQLYIQTKSI